MILVIGRNLKILAVCEPCKRITIFTRTTRGISKNLYSLLIHNIGS